MSMPDFAVGKISATDLNTVADAVDGLVSGFGVRAIAAASQSAAVNSTTLVSDTELTCPVTSGITYAIQAMVSYRASAAADFKYGFSIPTGTLNLAIMKYSPSDVLELVTMADITATDNTNNAGGAGTSSTRHMMMSGSFVASASGNLTFRFASANATGGEAAERRAGSWLLVAPEYP